MAQFTYFLLLLLNIRLMDTLSKEETAIFIYAFLLTLFRPVDMSILINWMSPFLVLGISGFDFYIFIVFCTEFPVSKHCRTG